MIARLRGTGTGAVLAAAVVIALLSGAALAHATGGGQSRQGGSTTTTTTTTTTRTTTGTRSTTTARTTTGTRSTTTARTTTTTTPTTATTPATTTTPGGQSSAANKAGNAATKQKAKTAKPAPVAPLTGVFGTAAAGPERTLLLTMPPKVVLTAANLRLSENSQPITGETIAPVTGAGASKLGVVSVVDAGPGMQGAPLADAMHAVGQLVAQRSPNQELGVITYGAKPSVLVPLTADASTIALDLQTTVSTSSASQILPALSLAYRQLQQAKLPLGAVVLLTNDAQSELPAGTSPGQLTADGRNEGYQTYVVAIGPHLGQAVDGVLGTLSRSYLIEYRSSMPRGLPVHVKATVIGVPGAVQAQYTATTAPTTATVSHRTITPVWGRHGTSELTPVFPSTPEGGSPAQPQQSSSSLLGSAAGLLPIAGVFLLLIAVVTSLMLRRRRGRRLQARVSKFVGQHPNDDLVLAPAEADAHLSPVHSFLARRKWWPNFVERVEVGRFKRSPAELVTIAVWGSVGVMALIVFLVGSLPLGILGLAVGPLALKLIVGRRARKQRLQFSEQLPSHLHDLAGAMRAGRSLVGALAAVAESSVEPIKGELDRALSAEQLGRPLEDALEAIATRMQSTDVSQVALIASLHRRTGSNVAESLERVAEGARERADMKRELKALTAQSKISGKVLTALPVFLAFAMMLIAPSYAAPMFKPVGIIVLVFCGMLVLVGWFVMRKITSVED